MEEKPSQVENQQEMAQEVRSDLQGMPWVCLSGDAGLCLLPSCLRKASQGIMITKEQAMTHTMFYHVRFVNADGTAVRARANGRIKLWKTRPDEWRLPVKYGLKGCFYLTPRNAKDWLTYDPTSPNKGKA